jgi:hypothetical protein
MLPNFKAAELLCYNWLFMILDCRLTHLTLVMLWCINSLTSVSPISSSRATLLVAGLSFEKLRAQICEIPVFT